jgi:prepilin-type processing-associated H-X9-DG protein
MCVDRVGRVQVTFAVLLAVAVPAAMFVHGKATAHMDSQLAAAAVTKALLALSQQAEAVRTETTPGEESQAVPVPEGEATAVVRVVDTYNQLLSEGKADLAWKLVHPDSVAGWRKDMWVYYQEAPTRPEEWREDSYANILAYGRNHQLMELKTVGETGCGRVVMDVEDRLTLLLLRNGDEWAIDYQGSSQVAAKSSVEHQIEMLTRCNSFEHILSYEVGELKAPHLPIACLPLENRRQEVTSVKIEGDRATVGLAIRGKVHLLVPVERDAGKWCPDWNHVDIIDPRSVTTTSSASQRLEAKALQLRCSNNLRAVAAGMMMYFQDYDERMPFADRWCDSLGPYVGRNRDTLTCPADRYSWSYAMNYKLSRQPLSSFSAPADTIMLFESTLGRPNAWDQDAPAGASLVNPPRHGDLNNFAFADGHVKALRNSEVQPGMYRVVDNPGFPQLSPSTPQSVTDDE